MVSKVRKTKKCRCKYCREREAWVDLGKTDSYLWCNQCSASKCVHKFTHYCPDWDWAVIREGDPEFEACICFISDNSENEKQCL